MQFGVKLGRDPLHPPDLRQLVLRTTPYPHRGVDHHLQHAPRLGLGVPEAEAGLAVLQASLLPAPG